MEMVGSCSCSVLSALREAGMRLPNGPAAEQGGDAGKGEPFPQNTVPLKQLAQCCHLGWFLI